MEDFLAGVHVPAVEMNEGQLLEILRGRLQLWELKNLPRLGDGFQGSMEPQELLILTLMRGLQVFRVRGSGILVCPFKGGSLMAVLTPEQMRQKDEPIQERAQVLDPTGRQGGIDTA